MSSKLIFEKFEGAGFKCDNSFYEIFAQEHANKSFLNQNFDNFILAQNFTFKQN